MRKTGVLVLLGSLFSLPVPAQQVDVPLRNWTVPPYTSASAGGGVTTMADVSPGVVFVAMTPCRIADTRGLGFSGPAGPPELTIATRTFQIGGTVAGVPAQCGIPVGADAVSFQFTVVTPNSAGNLVAWPAGGAAPTISVLNWNAGETALGNGTIVPISAAGALSVRINAATGSATGHLVIDVNGYFADTLHPANHVLIYGNFSNQSTLYVANASGVNGSRAILGDASAAGGVTWGVVGHTNSATATAAGVRGVALSSAPGIGTYGVQGLTFSPCCGASGVFGADGAGALVVAADGLGSGVRGHSSTGIGVRGFSGGAFYGVEGRKVNGAGAPGSAGRLGVSDTVGIDAVGAITATGTKSFVEPHPTDPTKEIAYVSLEGPEAGTYFRGRGRVQRGAARIAVPEDFRLVTDAEGLTVQVTPIGRMASFAVLRADLDGIVIEASRDVEFYYVVNGVRRTFRDWSAIRENTSYVPEGPDSRMPLAYSPEQRRSLIANGVFNEDGTVNRATAERLGWARRWAEREAESQRIAREAAARAAEETRISE